MGMVRLVDNISEEGIKLLCAHIIKKAAKDYYAACLYDTKDNDNYRQRLELFFLSDYYRMMSSIDGKRLIAVIKYRAKHRIKLFRGGEYLE